MLPVIKFFKMTLEENINTIKWAFFEDNGSLDVKYYTLEYFPELKSLDENLTKDEIYKKIEEVVTSDYNKYESRIEEEVIRYNSIWEKYNNSYISGISKFLNTDWPSSVEIIDAKVGLIPVFPRYLDTFSFSVSTGLKESKIIELCAHESLHFIWFKKWGELYPDCPIREYDSPYIPWQYSEMVTDPILNSKQINQILHIQEKSYDSFYLLTDNGVPVMDIIKGIYNESITIEEKIIKGYNYLIGYLNDKNKFL